jgi:hypothetical protein
MTSFSVRPLATALVIAQVLVSAAGGATAARPEAKPTIESVLQAWDQRQKQVQSFRFSWEATQWYDGAFLPSAHSGPPAEGLPASVSYDTRTTFVMDAQGRTRIERLDASWHTALKKLVPVPSINVCDGGIHRLLAPEGPTIPLDGAGLIPIGFIDRDIVMSKRTMDLLPVWLVFRPFDERIRPSDRKKLVLTEDQGVADGRTCLILRQADQIIWVDPKRSFIPLRVCRTARFVTAEKVVLEDCVMFQVEIHYAQDKESSWIPSSWRIEHFSGIGNVVASTTARVAAYKINSPIPEAAFQLPFLPGTWVNDRIKNESYILREGGKHRPVLPGEFNGKNYEQIRDSEPPVRPSPRGPEKSEKRA